MRPVKNIKKYLPLIVLPLALLVVLGLWANLTRRDVWRVYSDNGVWDLRDVDFEAGRPILLLGAVEMLPNALLCPAEFAAREDEAVIMRGTDGDFATSRLRVLLPDDRMYTFGRTSLSYNQRLYVNGVWVMDVGVPGETRETSVQEIDHITFTARPVDGVVEIVQQASNFVHRTQNWHHHIYVSTSPIDSMWRTISARSIIIGGFFAIFLVYIMLYFLLNRQKANLYFALFCLAWCVRIGVMRPLGPAPFTFLFPWLTWEMEFRMEYIFTLPAQSILLVAIINILFPGVLQRFFRRTIYIGASVIAVVLVFLDTVIMSVYLANIAYAVLSAAILYIVIRFAMKIRRVNLAQGIFLGGIVMMVYFALAEFLDRLGIVVLPLYMGQETSVIIALMFALCTAAAVFVSANTETEAAKESERKLSLEVQASDRVNRLRTEMMRTVSHEIRTPLSVMMGYAELSAEEARTLGMGNRMVQSLDAIAEEAKYMANVVEEMRQLALIPEYAKDHRPVDISEVISKVSGLFEKVLAQNARGFSLDMQKGLPKVFGTESELTSVMFNLLRNAEIHGEHGDVAVTAKRAGAEIEVTVADNGRGIDEKLLPKVFERGVSGGDGSGYGLSICRDIFDVYGGKISISSEAGKGTTVMFSLPVYMENEEGE